MKVLFAIAGAMLGAAMFGGHSADATVGGFLAGACIGFLIAAVMALQRRVEELAAALQRTQSLAQSLLMPAAGLAVAEVALPPRAATVEATVAAISDAPPIDEAQSAQAQASRSVVPAGEPVEPVESVEHPLWRHAREFFSGAHAIPRVGAIVLFFGVAFLLKYAAEHSRFPIELRLAGAALGAVALLVFGWRLRQRRAGYALVLQGAGIGVLYLTVFAALRLYSLIPPPLAFLVLVAVCASCAALAVLQNARSLALLGAGGGFLAPILTSSGAGSHVMLFSYYALLNAGIVGIAWFRAWRELNVLGFLFTFVIGVLWGVQRYRADLFASTEPFLILFVSFYVAVAVLFALRQPPDLRGYVDGTIVFGVPVVGFALQAALVHEIEYGLAWSAAAAGAFYLGLATLLWRRHASSLRLLCEAFLALGVVFATLALPLALDGRWTSAAWALEGAAIVWIGVRQRSLLARLFGAALIFAAGVFFLGDLQRPAADWPLLNSVFLGATLLALAALFAAYRLSRPASDVHPHEHTLAAILFAWGLLWWFGGGLREIGEYVAGDPLRVDAAVAFVVLSALAAETAGSRIAWNWLRAVALGLLPAGLLLALATLVVKSHSFTFAGAIAWTAFAAMHLTLLRRHAHAPAQRYLDFAHGATAWLAALLAGHELAWLGARMGAGEAWSLAGWGVALALVAVACGGVRVRTPWSELMRAHRQAYLRIGAAPVLGAACLWLLAVNFGSPGESAPLPYVPLLNPLDLASLLVLAALGQRVWEARAELKRDLLRLVSIAGAALAFLWLNAALVRTLHHWGGVPFAWRAMIDSVLVQASLSIFWTSIALIVMSLATRGPRPLTGRTLWMTGGGLLALTVAKLFLVDLARAGTVERIVSFIVVGLLLLLIGYLAPLPPADETKQEGST